MDALPPELLRHIALFLHLPFVARAAKRVCRAWDAALDAPSLRACCAKRRVVCDLDYLAYVAGRDEAGRFAGHGGRFGAFVLDARVCFTVMIWRAPSFDREVFRTPPPRGRAPAGRRWDLAVGGGY